MDNGAMQTSTDIDSANNYLSQVANDLAVGFTSRAQAGDAIVAVLGFPVFIEMREEPVQNFCDYWNRTFDSIIVGLDQAHAVGTGTIGQEVPLVSQDSVYPGPEDMFLVVSDQTDASTGIEALYGGWAEPAYPTYGATSGALDQSSSGWATNAQDAPRTMHLDAPRTMHPDASRTIIAVRDHSMSAASTFRLMRQNMPDFPKHLWHLVLRNRYVDLELIYSHFSRGDPSQAGKHKQIRSEIQWNYAWNRYASAVGLAFQHRVPELQYWRNYVSQMFTTAPGAEYFTIIIKERSMRQYIFNNASFCLWDAPKVVNLAFHLPAASGLNGPSASSSRTSPSASSSRTSRLSKPTKICIRFNTNDCNHGRCDYLHICSACGGAHGMYACGPASTSTLHG